MAVKRRSKAKSKKASRRRQSPSKVQRKKALRADPAAAAIQRILNHPLAQEITRWNEHLDERLKASGAYQELLHERERLGDRALSRAAALLRDFAAEREDAPGRLKLLPQDYETIPWSARQLDAFARRAQRVYDEARDVLGFEPEQVKGIAWLASNFALAKRGVAKKKKPSGRKLEPVTKVLADLDSVLKPIPAIRRRQLITKLMREICRVDAGSAEQIRLRLKDYRHRRAAQER